ncbi:MAG: HEAT repeat domain-containing protein [Vulcanimicrobiota bacterium]
MTRLVQLALCLLIVCSAANAAPPSDTWFEIYLFSRKVGYLRIQEERSETSFEGRQVFRRYSEAETLLQRGTDQTSRKQTTLVLLDGENGTPLFREERQQESDGEILITEQRFLGDTVHEVVRLVDSQGRETGPSKRRSYQRKNSNADSELALLALEERGYRVGDREDYLEYDHEEGLERAGHCEVVARRLASIQGESREVAVVDLVRGSRTVSMWLDLDGHLVRMLMEDVGMRFERCDREQALTMDTAGDVLRLMSVPVDGGIPRARELDELTLSLTMEGGLPEFPDGPYQSFQKTGHALRVRLTRSDNSQGDQSLDQPLAPELSPYLEPTTFIQSTAPEIGATAREVVGSETSARAASEKLARWVFENIQQKGYRVHYASAEETLRSREGDCTEHSLLFAALARSSGIPTRICVGLAFDGIEHLVWHQWSEVWLGDGWVPVDPSVGSVGLPSTYLKLAEAQAASELAQVSIPTGLQARVLSARIAEQELGDGHRDPARPRVEGGVFVDPGRGLIARLPSAQWSFSSYLAERNPVVLYAMIGPHGTAVAVAESLPMKVSLDDYQRASEVQLANIVRGYKQVEVEDLELAGTPARKLTFEGHVNQDPVCGVAALVLRDQEALVLMYMGPGNSLAEAQEQANAALSSLQLVAVGDLLAQIDSPDSGRIAIEALGILRAAEASGPIRRRFQREKKLPSDPKTLSALAWALARVAPEDSLSELLELAASTSTTSRVAAARALGALSAPAAMEALATLSMDDDYSVRAEAWRAGSEVTSLTLGPALATRGFEGGKQASRAATALARLNQGGVEGLSMWLASPRASLRNLAACQIAQMDRPEARQKAAELLRHSDPELRAWAARVAQQEVLEESIESSLADPDPEVVASVAHFLADSENLQALLVASRHPAAYARAAVLSALARLPDPQARERIRETLAGPHCLARTMVLNELEEPSLEMLPILLTVMREDPEPANRTRAAELAGALDYGRAAEVVEEALASEQDRIPILAAFCRLGGDRLAARLPALWQDPDPEFRRQFFLQLSQWQGPQEPAHRALLAGLADPDVSVREAALESVFAISIDDNDELGAAVVEVDVRGQDRAGALATWTSRQAIEPLVHQASAFELEYLLRLHFRESELGPEEYLPSLARRLGAEKPGDLSEALRGLDWGDNPAWSAWLTDKNPSLVVAACLALRRLRSPSPGLLNTVESLTSAQHPTVAGVALWTLVHHRPEAARLVVERWLKENDPRHRAAAWLCLGEDLKTSDRPLLSLPDETDRLARLARARVTSAYLSQFAEPEQPDGLAGSNPSHRALRIRQLLVKGQDKQAVKLCQQALEGSRDWHWRVARPNLAPLDGEFVLTLFSPHPAALTDTGFWFWKSGWHRGRHLPLLGEDDDTRGFCLGEDAWVMHNGPEFQQLWRYRPEQDDWQHGEELGASSEELAWCLPDKSGFWLGGSNLRFWQPGSPPAPPQPIEYQGWSQPILVDNQAWWFDDGLRRLDLKSGRSAKVDTPEGLTGTLSVVDGILQLTCNQNENFSSLDLLNGEAPEPKPTKVFWRQNEQWVERPLPRALAHVERLEPQPNGPYFLAHPWGLIVRIDGERVEATLLDARDAGLMASGLAGSKTELVVDFGQGVGLLEMP